MDISIIIPHYNSSSTLLRLLKSIPFDKDIEVIIVDDYSEKNEIDKIHQYINKQQIKFIKNNGKKGAGSGRNLGLKYVTKKWILFADSDDFFISKINKIFDINYEKYDVVYFPPISCYSDTLKEAYRHTEFKYLIEEYKIKNDLKSLNNLKYHWVVPWSKLIKTKLIKENNILFDECIAANDVMFSIKLAEKTYKINIENYEIYCVTVNKGSLTLNQSKENFLSRFEVLKRKNNFYKNKKLNEYITPGMSFLIKSRKYGIKIFIKVSIYTFINIKYIFNSKKKWKILLKETFFLNTRDKKYIVRGEK